MTAWQSCWALSCLEISGINAAVFLKRQKAYWCWWYTAASISCFPLYVDTLVIWAHAARTGDRQVCFLKQTACCWTSAPYIWTSFTRLHAANARLWIRSVTKLFNFLFAQVSEAISLSKTCFNWCGSMRRGSLLMWLFMSNLKDIVEFSLTYEGTAAKMHREQEWSMPESSEECP